MVKGVERRFSTSIIVMGKREDNRIKPVKEGYGESRVF
jgi:hypothetical protein